MDLSWVKWPVIIIVVGTIGFLFSSPGINYMYDRALQGPVGEDEDADRRNEATISRLAGLLLVTFRYERAAEMYETATDRYPDGKNAWWNFYQLARCLEKMDEIEDAVDILVMLRDEDADQYDERVPSVRELEGRIQKLVEINELAARPMV